MSRAEVSAGNGEMCNIDLYTKRDYRDSRSVSYHPSCPRPMTAPSFRHCRLKCSEHYPKQTLIPTAPSQRDTESRPVNRCHRIRCPANEVPCNYFPDAFLKKTVTESARQNSTELDDANTTLEEFVTLSAAFTAPQVHGARKRHPDTEKTHYPRGHPYPTIEPKGKVMNALRRPWRVGLAAPTAVSGATGNFRAHMGSMTARRIPQNA